MATMIGMALGRWLSGKIFDLAGSCHVAFINGIAWNVLNLVIALFLLRKTIAATRLGDQVIPLFRPGRIFRRW